MGTHSKQQQAITKLPSYTDMLTHFLTTILQRRKGKFLICSWVLGVSSTIVVILSKNRRNRLKLKIQEDEEKRKRTDTDDNKNEERNEQVINGKTSTTTTTTTSSSSSSSKNNVKQNLVEQLKPILRLAFPKFFCRTTFHLILFTFLLIARILLTVQIANITGQLGKMVGSKSWEPMFHKQIVFALWSMPAAFVNSSLHFETNELSLALRKQFVQYVHNQYLSNFVFYKCSNLDPSNRLENIDQIITQDLKKFCSQLSELYGNLLKPVLEVIILSKTLSGLMGWRQLLAFFSFFIVAGQWLRLVMPPFARLTAQAQRLEGEFRANHSRIITKSEEIAFYGGANREKQLIDETFDKIDKHNSKHDFLQLLVGIMDSYVVKYGGSMMAYSMLIPAIYLGHSKYSSKSASHIMQYYLTCTHLLVALGGACKNLVLCYKRIQSLAGYTIRISDLLNTLKKGQKNTDDPNDEENDLGEKKMLRLALQHPERTGGPPVIVEGNEIAFHDVDIFSPTGNLLVKGLNFKVALGTNVLISGPNGSGKSSLFRVLGGLWPLCSGKLVRPAQEKLFYVPQQPYIINGLTLRDQVTYPQITDGTSDTILDDLMQLVELTYVIHREGGWNTVRDWNDVLSGGEKQRVAMARLFYHKPAFGILDESTSAVSVDVEKNIYEHCKRLGITIFTVSHRPQLMHLSDYLLKFDGDGGWKWFVLNQNLSK